MIDGIKSEPLISITKYLGSAETCEEPDEIGCAAARYCGEAIVSELSERGYPKTAVIRGLREAVTDAERSLASPQS